MGTTAGQGVTGTGLRSCVLGLFSVSVTGGGFHCKGTSTAAVTVACTAFVRVVADTFGVVGDVNLGDTVVRGEDVTAPRFELLGVMSCAAAGDCATYVREPTQAAECDLTVGDVTRIRAEGTVTCATNSDDSRTEPVDGKADRFIDPCLRGSGCTVAEDGAATPCAAPEIGTGAGAK